MTEVVVSQHCLKARIVNYRSSLTPQAIKWRVRRQADEMLGPNRIGPVTCGGGSGPSEVTVAVYGVENDTVAAAARDLFRRVAQDLNGEVVIG